MKRQLSNSLPKRTFLAVACVVAPLFAVGQGQTPVAAATPAGQATSPSISQPANPSALQVRRLSLGQLGNQTAFRLRSTEGRADVNFGLRADELVTRAVLRLRYTYSPALIADQSHIKVLLNDEMMTTLPVTPASIGRPVAQDIVLDPRFIADFNRLTLQFVGHYAQNCELNTHTSLWADVSGASELELTVRPIVVPNDLAALPMPFFDPRDLGRLNLPFLFASQPSYETLRAAGVVASWFGQLADWRGARFTAQLSAAPGAAQAALPKGHAIAFATNAERPAFLAQQPPYTGPGLGVMTNPGDGFSRLLLVSGRDGQDLKVAVDALVRGTAALSGAQAAIRPGAAPQEREAYDAPRWVRTDRPMKFGELVELPQQLQAAGRQADSVRLNLRIPPDLYLWKSRGVPVDLKFRYTPPIRTSESRMNMSVNDELVQAVNLRSSEQTGGLSGLPALLMEGAMAVERKDVLVPPFKLAPRSQLQYAFSFATHRGGDCENPAVDNARAAIDADSTIDFSGFPHYVELPEINYFATLGFPFTKYADLSQTAVVMPEKPGKDDIETLLTLMGRMGESTGYPSTQVEVSGPAQLDAMKGKDLLLIGAAPNQRLLETWSDRLPAVIHGTQRHISQPARPANFLYGGFGAPRDASAATRERIDGAGPLATLLGFESPLSSGRSVVAVTAGEARDMAQVLDALETQSGAMHGSAVFVRGGRTEGPRTNSLRVESVAVGPGYSIGVVPFWTVAWFWLIQHPALLALLTVVLGFTALVALWQFWLALKKRHAAKSVAHGAGKGKGP